MPAKPEVQLESKKRPPAIFARVTQAGTGLSAHFAGYSEHSSLLHVCKTSAFRCVCVLPCAFGAHTARTSPRILVSTDGRRVFDGLCLHSHLSGKGIKGGGRAGAGGGEERVGSYGKLSRTIHLEVR